MGGRLRKIFNSSSTIIKSSSDRLDAALGEVYRLAGVRKSASDSVDVGLVEVSKLNGVRKVANDILSVAFTEGRNLTKPFTALVSGEPINVSLTEGKQITLGVQFGGTLQLQNPSYSGVEGTQLSFVLTRTNNSNGAIAVDWAISIAQGGPTTASGTVTWASGDLANKTVTVQLTLVSTTTSGTITLSNPRAQVVGGPTPVLGTTSSATLTVTDDTVAPTQPAISLASISNTEIDVTLVTPSTDTGGLKKYTLERATSSVGPFSVIASGLSIFPYADTGLTSSTTYFYRCKATDNANNDSSYSTTVSAPTFGSGSYVATDSIYDAAYDAFMGPIPSNAIYVATTGNDTTGTGSVSQPFKTLQKAAQTVAAGGTIVVENGTYTGPSNWINSYSALPPSGLSWTQPTRIRARNRFGVRITQTSDPGGYTQSIFYIPNTRQFIHIDGFICETTWTAPAADSNAAVTIGVELNCYVSRCIVKRSSCNQYGGWITYGIGCLVEDTAGYGSYRYGYQSLGSGDNTPLGQSVVRRALSYATSGKTLEPTASFSFYGSDDRTYTQVKEHAWLNCFEIDSPHVPYTGRGSGGAENVKWGSMYCPKSVRDIRVYGCGSLKCGGLYGGWTGDGFNVTGPAGTYMSFKDTWVHDFTSPAPSDAGGFWFNDSAAALVQNCRTSVLHGAADTHTVGATLSNNDFNSTADYLTMRVGSNGADQRFSYGSVGQRWGDTGFDQVNTNLPLWPYPYESYYASVFAEAMTVPSLDMPNPGTTTANPFAGTSIAGNPMTFTRRVWEAKGHATPNFASGAGVY